MRLKSRIMNLLIHGDRQWTEDSLEGDVMSSRLDRHILVQYKQALSSSLRICQNYIKYILNIYKDIKVAILWIFFAQTNLLNWSTQYHTVIFQSLIFYLFIQIWAQGPNP